MNISQITGIFFSPTGTTKQVTEWIAERIAADKEAGWLDLTDAISSRPDYTFNEHELAVVGVPVYGGLVPETARERLKKIYGKRTPVVLIVTYGNRAYEDALLELSIKGNRPYRLYATLPLKISVTSACEGCGTCIRKCPVQAISRTDPKVTDETACITCMRCIAVCPKHARKLGTLVTLAIRQKLKKVCTDRKDAEFIL